MPLGRRLEAYESAAMAQEVLRSFEEDFAWRLHREAQLLRATCALLGFAALGAVGLGAAAALPLLVGPAKVAVAAVAGGLGGCQWARRQSEEETQRQGVANCWEAGANALAPGREVESAYIAYV